MLYGNSSTLAKPNVTTASNAALHSAADPFDMAK
jgi:hypothetical protein